MRVICIYEFYFNQILSYLFLARFVSVITLSLILTGVAFLMITLSIEQMLPKVLSYKENKFMNLGFILGFIIILISIII